MEVERIPTNDGRIEMWAYEWDISAQPAVKVNRQFIGIEQPITADNHAVQREAICWSYGRTLGNIAVFSQEILGKFPAMRGDDAILQCDIVPAGKMRNGKPRWWCRTHQRHWGTLGDIAAARTLGNVRCSNHLQEMSYVIDPMVINVEKYAEVGIWCSMPGAITSNGVPQPRRPRIHVHLREKAGGVKKFDGDVPALSLHYNPSGDLFANAEITRVHVTPPAAMEFVLALEKGLNLGCVNCRDCGYPHLDLGHFAKTPHAKHLCGNCGRDNTWTRPPITSTPLKPLHDQFSQASEYTDVARTLNLDEHPDSQFILWASTPAVLWTAERPQERGIHVHMSSGGKRVVDDTFGTVIYQGQELDRGELLKRMERNTEL